MKQKLTMLFASLVCCAAGFMAGRISLGSDSSVENSSAPPPNQRTGPRAGSQSKDLGPRGLQARGHLGAQGPSLRAKSILKISDSIERTEAWLRFIQGLKPGDFEAVIDGFDPEDGRLANYREFPLLIEAWAEHDPIAAFGHLSEKGHPLYISHRIMSVWAAKDPEAVLSWVKSQREGAEAEWCMAGAIKAIALNDRQRATELMEQMPESSARDQALGAIQAQYVDQDPQAAREWALSLKDGELRDAAVSSIAGNLAKTDPEGALDWLIANPSRRATRNIEYVARQLAYADPEVAVAYLEKVSDPKVRHHLMRPMADVLPRSDPQKAFELLDANPSFADDHQWARLVHTASDRKSSLELAMKAAARMEDSEMRDTHYKISLRKWLYTDVEAAKSWVNQNELPDGMTQDEMDQFIEESIKLEERHKRWIKEYDSRSF